MEHLQQAHGHNKISILGAVVTNLSGMAAVVTANEVLVYVSIGTGLLTMGYTIDKWRLMRKRGKIDD